MRELLTAPDRLRALAEGPALDLPPVKWEAPSSVMDRVGRDTARWGALPWEDTSETWTPNAYVYLCDYSGYDPFIEVGEERYTIADARILLDRLASAIAIAEEVTR